MFIPPRTTSYLQPLDVLINSIFKAKMKAEWQNWMINGACEYTPKGYRKRPSWEIVFGFISRSLLSITKDDIIKSFILSGINRNCSNLNTEIVNWQWLCCRK